MGREANFTPILCLMPTFKPYLFVQCLLFMPFAMPYISLQMPNNFDNKYNVTVACRYLCIALP